MRFSTGQEVTPSDVCDHVKFGKIYHIRTYDHDFICGCGSIMFQLQEFPESFIFCEKSFDGVGTLDEIQKDLNSLGNVQIEHLKKKE